MRAIVHTGLGLLFMGGACIAFQGFRCSAGRAQAAAVAAQIAAFNTALKVFAVETGGYPAYLLELVRPPPGTTNWRGPYLDADEVPKDSWGREYVYAFPGKQNTNSFDLMSVGPDRRPGTEDDIAIEQAN